MLKLKKFDPGNLYQVLIDSSDQISNVYEKSSSLELNNISIKDVKNIVVCGLGGSAIAADVFKDVFSDDLKYPYTVNRTYNLPTYVSNSTLLICSSYSGNTEETLSAFDEGVQKGCKIVVLTTGGKLLEKANKLGVPVLMLKPGFQPRFALYSNLTALIKIFEKLKVLSSQKKNIKEAVSVLTKQSKYFGSFDGYPKHIAAQIKNTIAIVYAFDGLNGSLAVRFKGQLNENGKIHSFANIIPEMNHNEIVGWETVVEKKHKMSVFLFNDKDAHPQNKKRWGVMNTLFEKYGLNVIVLESSAENKLVRAFELIYLGDWISYFTALLNRRDPGEIDNIHFMKNNL